MRLVLNDEDDTDFLAGLVIDRESGARVLSLETGTRLGDNWVLEARYRDAYGLPRTDPGYGLRRDQYLQLRLERYF